MADVKPNGALANHERTREPGLAVRLSRSAAERIMLEGKQLPLDFLVDVYNDGNMTIDTRVTCARAALPFVHPKLVAVQADGSAAARHEDAIRQLADEDDLEEGDGPTVVIASPPTDSAH